MKLLSLFSGVGTFEMALRNLNVNYELVGFSEIDKYAIKSYCAIHGINEGLNLGDITKINIENLPNDIDIITHGSPCQSFSSAGLQHGGDEGSGTRSSLMWNTVEIVKHCKPKYVIWENVKNVLSKNHKHNFDKYIDVLKELGYASYYKILNAKNYGVPQNRERVFVVSILGEHKPYEFPNEFELTKKLKDVLEDEVDEKYYINKKWHFTREDEQRHDINEIAQIDEIKYKATRSVTDINKICRTLDTMGGGQREPKILENTCAEDMNNYRIRKLTPLECWRLMGISDEDFYRAKNVGISNSQLYKQAGNAIVVNVLEEIFRNLFLKWNK